MKMNCHKRDSCLSQAPLISKDATNNKLTPISAHSLTLQSPSKIATHQPSCSTPQIVPNNNAQPRTSSLNSQFFPPLPPRSISSSSDWQKQQQKQQQDENYHLYHDLDEEADEGSQRSPKQPLEHMSQPERAIMTESSPTLVESSIQRSPLPPLPPVTRTANIATTISHLSERAISALQISQPTDINNNSTKNNNITNACTSTPPSNVRARQGRTFAERANLADDAKQNPDVSADVYFQYVTLKSTERSNHRSRSYHGPKNTSANQLREQFVFAQSSNTMKNFSSTSVAELPLSPNLVPASPTIPIHFRDHCVRELIDTETNYVHALEMIINCFARPLEVLLKKEQNQLIFGHIKYFHHVHSTLRADLIKAASRISNDEMLKFSSPSRRAFANQTDKMTSSPSTPTLHASTLSSQLSPLSSPTDVATNNRPIKISTCFLNAREKFLKYGEYCASLSKAQAMLDELSKNETISAQLNRCQHEANEGRFKLRDLLSLPMQRILKYHLLIAQMIKNTHSSNDDYQGLKRAHEAMVDLGQYINEVKRDTEAMQIVNDIEQSIIALNMPENTKLEDYGRLIMDGTIRMKRPHEASKIKLPHDSKRYVFVFDKVILMCKDVGLRRYQYKEALVLSEFELDENPIISCETLSKHKDKHGHNFDLIRASDKASYSFYPKSLDAKTKWINSIKKAMDNIRPSSCRSSSHKFLMHTFEKASSCDHCGKLLLGLYYQGYRCQVCFASVHKKCIPSIKACGPILPQKAVSNKGSSNDLTHPDQLNSYVNFIPYDRPWFCGRMDRDEAEALLENTPSETFLVRVSSKHNRSYVISLNHDSQVKHMKINISRDNRLFLSQNRYFKSLVELVSWYEENSLVESFHMLDARLSRPIKIENPSIK